MCGAQGRLPHPFPVSTISSIQGRALVQMADDETLVHHLDVAGGGDLRRGFET
jgi:hypothetical protein